ncbi:MAG: pilus assembly protein [Chloroflexi bacterium]|nr:pilus assembly protein [Chloroflexota bacterium]
MPGRTTRRGQTMVEFALGLPILLLIIIGVVEIGRAVLAYTVVGNVSREGARYAIMTTAAAAPSSMPASPDTDASKLAWWQKCNAGHTGTSVVYTPADFAFCDGWPNVVSSIVSKSPGLSLSRVEITVSYNSPSGTLDGFNRSVPITVAVRYTHPILFGQFLRLPAPLNTIILNSSSTMLTQ